PGVILNTANGHSAVRFGRRGRAAQTEAGSARSNPADREGDPRPAPGSTFVRFSAVKTGHCARRRRRPWAERPIASETPYVDNVLHTQARGGTASATYSRGARRDRHRAGGERGDSNFSGGVTLDVPAEFTQAVNGGTEQPQSV